MKDVTMRTLFFISYSNDFIFHCIVMYMLDIPISLMIVFWSEKKLPGGMDADVHVDSSCCYCLYCMFEGLHNLFSKLKGKVITQTGRRFAGPCLDYQ